MPAKQRYKFTVLQKPVPLRFAVTVQICLAQL